MVFTIHTPKSSKTETKRSEAVSYLAAELLLMAPGERGAVVNETHAMRVADGMIMFAEAKGSDMRRGHDYNVAVTVLREDF